ncbi:MAG: S26 family signal peptidase [Thermoplasmata archaeon]|nr:MAG: S26 family signal peptidase [Thermoplasmata archaeon]OYT61536.1 MAG: S26 family signal peptidase [Thermoplasmatales archaeon ex4484_30]
MEIKKKTILFIRDILISIAVVGVILASLWAYTGQFPNSPMVVVTSSSMMHENAPFGKIGTIDPGDLVLVKSINGKDDVETRGPKDNPTAKHRTYGDYGDVIIYIPDKNKDGKRDRNATPIIHRAICWVEKNEDGTYTIKEYGIQNATSITIDELGLHNYKPPHSGFITKGDNNNECDQCGLSTPVKPSWIIGKARGEIPWFGLIKLMIFGNDGGYDGPDSVRIGRAVAPKDEWICLGLSLFVIIVIPTAWDIYNFYKRRKSEEFRL